MQKQITIILLEGADIKEANKQVAKHFCLKGCSPSMSAKYFVHRSWQTFLTYGSAMDNDNTILTATTAYKQHQTGIPLQYVTLSELLGNGYKEEVEL